MNDKKQNKTHIDIELSIRALTIMRCYPDSGAKAELTIKHTFTHKSITITNFPSPLPILTTLVPVTYPLNIR